MSFDVNFVPGPSARAGEDVVIDVWGKIEAAFGDERLEALEDAGMDASLEADELGLSIPYGVADRWRREFDALVEVASRELEPRGWLIDEETSSWA